MQKKQLNSTSLYSEFRRRNSISTNALNSPRDHTLNDYSMSKIKHNEMSDSIEQLSFELDEFSRRKSFTSRNFV
jgi:hypothetical protein